MNVIGTDTTTPEGQARARIADLLAQAVAEATRRPGTNNAHTIQHLVDKAQAELDKLERLTT